MKWLRKPRIYIKRLRLSRRELGVSIAVTVAALISFVALLSGVFLNDDKLSLAGSKPIVFTIPAGALTDQKAVGSSHQPLPQDRVRRTAAPTAVPVSVSNEQ